MKKLLIMSLLSASALAAPLSQKIYHYEKYNEAKKAPSQIKFMNASKEFGLFTHNYDGMALDFKIQYLVKEKSFTEVKVEIPVTSIDTDNNDRNKKMHTLCFEAADYPYLTITFLEPVKMDGSEQSIPAKINIRGHDKPITIHIKASETQVSGTSKMSFKELDIPDPSIAIASIKDEINLEFKVNLDQ
ncbi:MAG: YceI family protein [Bacteriovoracaceae bacterium]